MDTRMLSFQNVANSIEAMVNRYIDEPIVITYEKLTEDSGKPYSDWDRQRFQLRSGEEYFLIRRRTLLYAVNVTSDSILTAAHELMDLIARKF